MKPIKYVGPHDGVAIHDAPTGWSGEVERDQTISAPNDVAERLVAQGDFEDVQKTPRPRAGKTTENKPRPRAGEKE